MGKVYPIRRTTDHAAVLDVTRLSLPDNKLSAEFIAARLGGRKVGGHWAARCPAHDDQTPSLSIKDTGEGKVLVHCHAGCAQRIVIAELAALGLWNWRDRTVRPHVGQGNEVGRSLLADEIERRDIALAIWNEAQPAPASKVEAYLALRGINVEMPDTLRFHPGLRHPSGNRWPAMVALVTRGADDAPLGIHRTFLSRRSDAKAPVDPQRMMLGRCRGGAVRLATPAEVLMVGEGIETCLAAMKAIGHPAWAALSTSGLRALDLPNEVRHVIVLADGDASGEAAARDCASRWKAEGRRVRIARPPQGMDFNDILMGRTRKSQEGVQ